ncbi:hypothetical protein RB6018 [Rhodopirellula baltica SH 1]|uniref:Uncharacterized protein n=2 Tax=Rhodopirellula baltica TaxID=265606 RepID=Q7UQX6_RHOBA|nr:hypothetical protein RB6018 [Rhodopirellula baltica SH 1]
MFGCRCDTSDPEGCVFRCVRGGRNSMKKIGPEFQLLRPNAEKALHPVWMQVSDLLVSRSVDFDSVLWTTDYLSSTLAVRITNADNESHSPMNDLLYSTPAIANLLKVLKRIHEDDFGDEVLLPFRSVYESWIDHVILRSFNSSRVKKALRRVISDRPTFSVVSTTVDEGFAGDVRKLWPCMESRASNPPR